MTNAWVRRAAAGDIDSLVTLRAEMFRAMQVPGVEGGAWRENAGRWFAERLARPDYGIFVVESDGEVVACAMGAIRDSAPSPGSVDGRDVLISNVCALPGMRGAGHGRRAFDAVMDWARATGVGRAELMATDDGRRIYQSAGFSVTHFPAMRATLGAHAP